jgi:hypothetical protein
MDYTEDYESLLPYQKEVQFVFDKEVKFSDNTFPPNVDSLFSLNPLFAKLSEEKRNKWLDYTWKRLGEIFETHKFLTNVSPTTIKQGALGNCYLMSALSAMAEFPG